MSAERGPRRDYLHDPGGPRTRWSRTNAAEAITNSPTPMGWNLWSEYCSRGILRGWADFGLFSAREASRVRNADERLNSVFFGHPVANVDMLCRIADLTPGTSGADVEAQVLGTAPSREQKTVQPRYLAIALKMPVAALTTRFEVLRNIRRCSRWWSATIEGLNAGRTDPRDALAQAASRFEHVMRAHARASNIAGVCYQRIAALAAQVGMQSDQYGLAGGYGNLKDTDVLDALWRVAQGQSSLASFIHEHGYHGPGEGEISSRSWREDAAPVESVLAGYRNLPADQSPRAVEQRRIDARRKIERELLRRLHWWQRPRARLIFFLGARFTLAREEGKSAFLMMIDVARAAARRIGQELYAKGCLDRADDVFFLTIPEALNPVPEAHLLASARRARWEDYKTLDLPESWTGEPTPVVATPPADGAAGTTRLTGIGVSPGIVEGPVRVILDAGDAAQLEPGEILVCPYTDPSWGSLIFLAHGLIVDIGGPLSHGAIIAREVNKACVVNVGNATKRLCTGDRVRMDGAQGTVEIVASGGRSANMPLVYAFDHPHPVEPRELKALLGGKGANLTEMSSRLHLPVPPGFVIGTEACRRFLAHGWFAELEDEITAQLRRLEAQLDRRLGDAESPLVLSVRSGAAASMPGMMETILNLGLNESTVRGLAHISGDAAFAADCHRRFLAMYRRTVGSDDVPERAEDQLRAAIEAVFRSWGSDRAAAYREREGLDHSAGTAVTVQAMVFGNLDDRSASGVCFSRNPATGETLLYGDILFRAQGEDVVAGTHSAEPLEALKHRDPAVFAELERIARLLERHYQDLVDIEFTVESGKLWILQVRSGKRSPQAALRIAHDLAIDPTFNLSRVDAVSRVIRYLANPPRRIRLHTSAEPMMRGLPASPGVACGVVAFGVREAEEKAGRGLPVILVRAETSPEDVRGMAVAAGILTARGGLASHAAVVARGWGVPAVVGAAGLEFLDDACVMDGHRIVAGDELTIDGSSGAVFPGRVTVQFEEIPEVATLRRWAQECGLPLTTVAAEQSNVQSALESPAPPSRSTDDVLLVLCLKGIATPEMLGEIFGLQPEAARTEFDALRNRGLIEPASIASLRASAAGAQRIAQTLGAIVATAGAQRAVDLVETFAARFDVSLKQIVTDWQLVSCPGGAPLPNDHSDPAYDDAVLNRLRTLHDAVVDWLPGLPSAPHATHFAQRLARSLARCLAGDRRYVAGVTVDSYHSVWFELHEYLIRLAGRTRGAEQPQAAHREVP
jgi:pyruvate,orthophosphate dikinase